MLRLPLNPPIFYEEGGRLSVGPFFFFAPASLGFVASPP
jgi:hypothetical protein